MFCPLCFASRRVAGSTPATSTNHSHFNEISSKFSCVTTCYSGRRSEVLSPEGSTNVSGQSFTLHSPLHYFDAIRDNRCNRGVFQ